MEGRIAAGTALEEITGSVSTTSIDTGIVEAERGRVTAPLRRDSGVCPQDMEERLQELMDEHAGGVSARYELSEERLLIARGLLARLRDDT
ncbi:MAG: adenylylsulfate reductase, partial [Candidatus Brocadiales bacterium]